MAGRIPRQFIDDLLVRVDIVDLIDSYVPLKKTGGSYTARCPFHAEKTPSFSVNRNKQFYHCFGCGVGGNAISFLMAFSHLDFVEAVEDLAGFAGLVVPRESGQYQGERHDYSALYSMLERLTVFYAEQLRSHPQGKKAIDYLKARGISGQVAKQYALGFSPNQKDWLVDFDSELLADVGVLAGNDKGAGYDRFRGRLIFPIRDKRGRTLGFGGRVLNDTLPKYLNSPETPVFSKGRELYGLYELLAADSKPKRILIVEGYMDVLALAEFGLNYSVAALGTAFSKSHLDLLFRFTRELIFCFDGDAAGRKAGWRAIQESFSSLKDGRQIKIMLMPQGHDPDTLVREVGLDGFEENLHESKVLSDFYFEFLTEGLNLTVVEDRALLMSRAKPDLERIPAGFFREMMYAKLKELVGGASLAVFGNQSMLDGKDVQVSQSVQKKSGGLSPVRVIIALLLQNPELFEIIDQYGFEFSRQSFPGADLLSEIMHTIEQIKPANSAVLVEYFRGGVREKVINTLVNWDFFILDEGVEAEFVGAVNRLQEQVYENELNLLLLKEKQSGLDLEEKVRLRKLLMKKIK